jgi:23S rRNA pseudouridine1911/1915/1917 synthase
VRGAEGGSLGHAEGSRGVPVPSSLAGQRLDRAVALLANVSRARANSLLGDGRVRVDGEVVRTRHQLLREGQHLEVNLPVSTVGLAPDLGVPYEVVLEDPDLLVVDKPPGVSVHPGAGRTTGTLVQGLLARYPELAELPPAGAGDPGRPGIVHRIDRDTSGLLVVARTPAAYHALRQAIDEHRVERTYLALVHGQPEDRGLVDAPIGRSLRHPDRMAVQAGGRPARSWFEVLARYDEPRSLALLRVTLETGRTHQIRVHLAAIGHPVVGDRRYGRSGDQRSLGALRQWLHASELALAHPLDGRPLRAEAPLPHDLRAVLKPCR